VCVCVCVCVCARGRSERNLDAPKERPCKHMSVELTDCQKVSAQCVKKSRFLYLKNLHRRRYTYSKSLVLPDVLIARR